MIIFIHHSVNPYRIALFNKMAISGIPFKVYFLSKPAKNREWKIEDFDIKFPHLFLDGFKFYIPGNDHWYYQINFGLWKALARDKPTLIISFGWNFTVAASAFFYSKLRRVKYAIWSGSTEFESSLIRILTLPFVKFLVRRCDYLIAYGSRAKRYLISLGANPTRISIAYNSIDTEAMIKELKKVKKYYFLTRKRFGISRNTKIVLFVGQYLKRKGVYPLLNVAKRLKERNDLVFLMVGYGPEKKGLSEYIKLNNLENVFLVGYIRNDELPKYYVAADVFILPSFEEVWGLTVNEAMCFAKPILVSKFAGCVADLVKKGINGYTINPFDDRDIAVKINVVLSSPDKKSILGKASLKIIGKVNYDQNINQIKKLGLC
jgi:glycosyltransferase involved in cell wall biosynthesis